MEAKTKNKKLQKRLYIRRNQKNCIPPVVQAVEPGEYNGIDEYRDFHKQCAPTNHVTIKNRSGKGRKLNKGKPWYYLTKKEHIAIENNRKSSKMTHQDYIEGYLKQKLSKWEMKHPKPKEDDLFYKEDLPKWQGARYEFAVMLSNNYAKKEHNCVGTCKPTLMAHCKDYHKCHEHFMDVLGYTFDEHGNSLKKAA